MFTQESLAVCLVDITSLPECLVCEVTIRNKKGYIAVIYRSPNKSSMGFESFLSGFQDMLSSMLFSKSQFTVILGDFNDRPLTWLSNDITNLNGTLIDLLTTAYGFKKLISDTNILPKSMSCIDLIFTDKSNYVIDCDTHPSLHKNCHHQITFCKLNLKVEYPPTYQCLAWNFKKPNNDASKRAIELVNCNSLLSHKNVHEQNVIFNQTLMNIFSNYIPNKLITIDDKDPPWMNDYIKRKIMEKKVACKSFNTNNKNYDAYLKLQTISTELSEMISKRKYDYHSQLSDKFNSPMMSSKGCWTFLKTLYNGKKIPLIPLILVNNKLISVFKEKALTISILFASQCTPVSNDNALPNTANSVSNVSLSSIHFEDQDILKIIHSLN